MAQNSNKNLSHSGSQELHLMWLCFLVHMCKMMIYPAIFFHFFQNSNFSCLSKFINKCQKVILRYAPPSSHVCDFSDNHWQKLWEKLLFGQFCVSTSFQLLTVLRTVSKTCVRLCYGFTALCRGRRGIFKHTF